MLASINIKKSYYILFLIGIVLFTRIICSETFFYGYDSVSYALAVTDFSLEETRPHLPGSILFVKLISIINFITDDTHTSFLLLINIFSALAALFSFLFFRRHFPLKLTVFFTLLLIFNPMVWFYGSVTEVYTFDWFLGSLILFLSDRRNAVYLFPVIIAIAAGFRQSSGVLLAPFYFYLLYKTDTIIWKKIIISVVTSIIIFLLWFIPLVQNAGGLNEYIELYKTNNPMEQISFAQNIFRLSSLMFYFLVPLVVLIFPFYKSIFFKNHNLSNTDKSKLVEILTLIVPAILFFVFSHYSKGYALLIATPLFGAIGILIKNKLRLKVLIVVIIFELLIFLFLPASKPALETKIKPSIRNSSVFEIWQNRTFSNYHLGRQNIVRRDTEIKNIKVIINETNNKKYFLGPTLSNKGRALQIEFPDIEFITIDFHDSKNFRYFKGLNVYKKKAKIDVRNTLFIVGEEFTKAYLNGFKIIYKANEMFVLSLTKPDFEQYKKISDSLFVR